jgi:hypothetical protein
VWVGAIPRRPLGDPQAGDTGPAAVAELKLVEVHWVAWAGAGVVAQVADGAGGARLSRAS